MQDLVQTYLINLELEKKLRASGKKAYIIWLDLLFRILVIKKINDTYKIEQRRDLVKSRKMQQKTMSTLMLPKSIMQFCKKCSRWFKIKSRWSKKKFEDIEKIANQCANHERLNK